MAEPKNTFTTTSVLATDFLEWMESRNGEEAVCPICKYRSWNLLTTVDGEKTSLVAQFTYPATVGSMDFGKAVIQLECKRCAFLAFFTASTVSQWVKDGKPPFKDDPADGE